MYQLIYPALFGALVLFYTKPAMASEKQQTQLQPLHSVVIQNRTTDWKQANQKVAELGGWQFYASEAGAHQGMDHSGHKMPVDHSQHHHKQHLQHMDHSQHAMPEDHSKHHQQQMDHSQHAMPEDHSKHHQQQMDHSQHAMPEDHSKHHQQQMDHSKHHQQQMDHSKHSEPQPVKTGDEHEHHH